VGHFVLPSELDVARFLFIAGGTGIAPLRAMMNRVLRGPYSSIGVFYSARTVSDFAYEDELRQLAQSGRIELKQTVTREVGEDWGGVRGRISSSELARLVHDLETLCFLCGPPALVQDMPKLLAEIGVPPGRIRIEEWSQRSPA
jgi:ferredoxin-NADP reductase